MGHVHTGQIAHPFEILMFFENAQPWIVTVVPQMWRAFGKSQQMVQELIRILPCFVLLGDHVEYLLFCASFANVLWVDNLGVDVTWVIVIYDDFVDAVNCCCTCDAPNLNGFVVGLFRIESPAARQSQSDCPVAAFGGIKYGSRSRCVNILDVMLLDITPSLLGRAGAVV